MSFRILPLPRADFAPLFGLGAAELARHGVIRVTASGHPGWPCRVSLDDAQPGETLLLLHHTHIADPASPYRSGYAIYVREGAEEAHPEPGAVPPVLTRRPIAVRGFGPGWMLRSAVLAEGEDAVAEAIAATLADPEVAEVHLHNALPGCYAARAVRA